MSKHLNPNWPVLTSYDRDHLARIALPLGGIGTGTVSLGGRGDLRDWEIVNRASKGFQPQYSFFALHTHSRGQSACKVLEGPIDPPFDSANGFRGSAHGLPRFRNAAFHAAYPFGQVLLSDPDMPLRVRIEAFNPLVPPDPDASGLPAAIVRFVLHNPTAHRVTATVCGNLRNFIGSDGVSGEPCRNRNAWRETTNLRGLLLSSEGVARGAEQAGTIAMTTTARRVRAYALGWPGREHHEQLAAFWHAFSMRGDLPQPNDAGSDAPMASLAVRANVPPRAERTVTFVLAWHFPNRMTWTPETPGSTDPADRVGNYYATRHADAWAAAEHVAARLPKLERDTLSFVSAFAGSRLPAEVKEAALYNLSTLRTQTCFRTEDGRFFGWEGCCDDRGCCHGSCTHVWNYEQATAFLFAPLARMMREVEFLHALRDDGLMCFRANLPLDRAARHGYAAADGQMGCLMKLYRDWQLSGDYDMLRRLWPRARAALEFAWRPGGWDADRDGVMEGCQHNTTDLEFYGPNPLMAAWYLGALRAAEEMARRLGETGFADECRALFESGRQWVDAHLFNGEHYVQDVRPAAGAPNIAAGLALHNATKGAAEHPPQQPENGCMTDQLVGQYMANVCGLGPLLDPRHVARTLRSIMQRNFIRRQRDHAHLVRAFVMNDESVLTYGTYPEGETPQRPCYRFFENWTGVEYAAAVLMMQEGRVADGLKVFRAVRDRFDGRKRNPFDEPECGHHYARAMASWAAVQALTGFRYSAVAQTIAFAPAGTGAGYDFWSSGDAWGTVTQRREKGGVRIELTVKGGALRVRQIELTGRGQARLPRSRTLRKGQRVNALVS